ncbi:hypothetical protein BDF14DRAFT_1879997 [Spinellus fusiger]|nr:hypothetical protein BDF14DRAFT_1879997 [Spinellus fusiger]
MADTLLQEDTDCIDIYGLKAVLKELQVKESVEEILSQLNRPQQKSFDIHHVHSMVEYRQESSGITRASLEKACQRQGIQSSDASIMLDIADGNQDGIIDFEEFQSLWNNMIK